MLGKGLCDFISWQLRFRNLFRRKGRAATCERNKTFSAKRDRLPHMKTTKPNRSPSVTGWALNESTKPRLSRSSQYRARCAPAYPGYRNALSHQADQACIPGTPRQARITPMRSACDVGRRLCLDTQLQGAQVACQLVLLTRRDHGGNSRANGLLAAEAGFGKQLAHQDDVG